MACALTHRMTSLNMLRSFLLCSFICDNRWTWNVISGGRHMVFLWKGHFSMTGSVTESWLVFICLAGNVNILDVFKRLILKTYLCVVLMCQPDTADMLPTLQLLMVFFHVICRVVSLITNMSEMKQPASVGEAQQKRQQCNERAFLQRRCNKERRDNGIGWWRRRWAKVTAATNAGRRQI